jgi:serine O-acetyltransferase
MKADPLDRVPWSLGPRVRRWLDSVKAAIFPGYGEPSGVESGLVELVGTALGFGGPPSDEPLPARAAQIASRFVAALPGIREQLAEDALAALDGDPSVHLVEEVVLCYPSLQALLHHRIAHRLFREGVPLVPRIASEIAHAETGIDIHPGAVIGDRCFIDHGTGVVIGATAILGRNVRLYQGVTLGARGFPTDEGGRVIKDQPRHPIIEDDVVIYAGAAVLGRVRVGRGSVIGGNVWVTRDVPPGTRILQSPFRAEVMRGDGDGI